MLRPKRNIRANGKPNYITPEDGFYGSGARNRSRNWVRVALHGAEVGGFGRDPGALLAAEVATGRSLLQKSTPQDSLSPSLSSQLIALIAVDIKFNVWYDDFAG